MLRRLSEPRSNSSPGCFGLSFIARISWEATARPRRGGTEFPICLKPCHFVTWKRNQSGYECKRAASRTVMHRGLYGWIGRGDVKAPRSLPVPARNVLQTPSGSNFRKRLIGSTLPCPVASKRARESSVCSVRIEDVSQRGSHLLGYEKSPGSGNVPRRRFT